MTEAVAREALLSFVNSKCCYGTAAARDFVIQELRQQTLCRVRLWTGHWGVGTGGAVWCESGNRSQGEGGASWTW